MKITIEAINGEPMTVIHKPFDGDWVIEQLALGNSPCALVCDIYNQPKRFDADFAQVKIIGTTCDAYNFWRIVDFEGEGYEECSTAHFAELFTILPALPRHPKLEDEPLLYRYMAEKLSLFGFYDYCPEIVESLTENPEMLNADELSLTGQATYIGERVEIAIKD